MRLTASSHSAFARPAQQGTAPAASPMQSYLVLCRLCFAMMFFGAAIVALALPALVPGAPMAFRAGLIGAGLLLWIAAEGWLALVSRASPDGALVSISIFAGLALMLAGWLIALNVI
jgi:hypothetical protein